MLCLVAAAVQKGDCKADRGRFSWVVRAKLTIALLVCWCASGWAKLNLNKTELVVETGAAERLALETGAGKVLWESSDPKVAQVLQNGFVIGLTPGETKIRVSNSTTKEGTECAVKVTTPQHPVVNPEKLKQYPDSRMFMQGARKCYGSELNGQRASGPDERRYTRANRVINPRPLHEDKPLEWEVQEGTEIYDGAGVLLGTVAPRLKTNDRMVPSSKFNFGMSKVLNGRLCLYAFSVWIKPSEHISKLVDPSELSEGSVGTSAWLPLDRVVDRETLVERIGLGKPELPALPLESTGYRVTGGNPKMYMTEFGEMSIVRNVGSGPVPSHYLRRPSGTVNVLYSVPGFGLGGQGLDSFLAGEGLEFYAAKGAKVFVQPTYFPPNHPKAGKVSPQTMTFIYGAVKAKGCEPTYGWIAKEALSAN